MVLLPWTPPYDWAWMVGFLQARAVAGVERFHDGGYSRSFGVEGHRGLIHLAPDEEAQGLRVTLSPGLQPVAEICYARIGQLFDLACDPRQVARTLGDLAQARPGLRLPGALDTFEQAVRAVLGQPPLWRWPPGSPPKWRLAGANRWRKRLDMCCSRRQRPCPGPTRRRLRRWGCRCDARRR